MVSAFNTPAIRCAIYTRKSTEEGLEQEFNSLDAQRESAESYITSMRHEGWQLVPKSYDDGGFTGGNMERPALHRLLEDIEAGKIDCVVVYKVDRLSRSLMDFARMMNVFEKHSVSFVSVTQQFNTASSMGRLVLNVLLSFAQFEREMISERVRDKIAASRRKGKYVGGQPILGYNVENTKLIVDETEADQVRQIFELYLEHQAMLPVVTELNRRGWLTKRWVTRKGIERGAKPFTKNSLHNLLTNIVYIGKIRHKENVYEGEHEGIVPEKLFERTRKTLKRNSRSGGSAVRNKHGALLRGILRCECCDAAMSHTYTSKGSRQYRYYVCGRARQRGWDECPSPSIPAGEIEQFVVAQIREIGSDPELIREVTAKACEQASAEILKLQQERQTLLKQIRTDWEQIESLAASCDTTKRVSAFADLNKRQETAKRRLDEIELEFESLTAEQIDTAEVSAALSNFHELWAQLRPKEQARLLALLIEQVDHDGRHGNVSITFHPAGIRTLMQKSVDLCEVAV
jgi:site-specific DNA recombinase